METLQANTTSMLFVTFSEFLAIAPNIATATVCRAPGRYVTQEHSQGNRCNVLVYCLCESS